MKKKKAKPRGFAAMTPEMRKAIAAKGGKAAQRKGTAHKWTPAEAVQAGRKGGQAAQAKGTAYKWTSATARKAAKARRKASN